MSSEDAPRGGQSEPIVYGPLPRPWLDLWVIPATFVALSLISFIPGGRDLRLTCERNDEGGTCVLYRFYAFVPVVERAFAVDDVDYVRFDPGPRDAYTWAELPEGEVMVDRSDLFGEERYEEIDRFFADPDQARLDLPMVFSLMTVVSLVAVLIMSFMALRIFFRRPSRIEIHVEGSRARVEEKWLGVTLHKAELDLTEVDRIRVTHFTRTKTDFQAFGTRPATRIELIISNEGIPLHRELLFGEAHEGVARALGAHLNVEVVRERDDSLTDA